MPIVEVNVMREPNVERRKEAGRRASRKLIRVSSWAMRGNL